MQITLDHSHLDDYRMFLKIKQLPTYKFTGNTATFPDEYVERLGICHANTTPTDYEPISGLFDYQEAIARTAITKRKYCVFADCGLGKTLIFLEFARHAAMSLPPGKCVLIVSPLMVIQQTIDEAHRFYGGNLPIEQIAASQLPEWLATDGHADSRMPNRIGITNYESLRDNVPKGCLGALILDESSMLKSHYGKWGTKAIELGRGLDWKMACSGTPAPNDRIEYANHAVFMDAFPTVNSFLARFFVNRGQTQERWSIKPHALEPFYRALSHWSIFLTNPATYGWKDNCGTLPPINVHVHDVEMTDEQINLTHKATGDLFACRMGGITNRATLASIGKGWHKGKNIASNKYEFMRSLISSWPDESTLIWCIYNKEQDLLERTFPEAGSIRGDTPHEQRQTLVDDFKAGRLRTLISKPKILGFGLNLERATRQVFSGLQDSYESYYQAVKRSNRYGATRPLNVHIPVTDIELPMVENVIRKAHLVQRDTEQQERIFCKCS